MRQLVINNRIIDEDPVRILQDVQSIITNGKLRDIKIKGSDIIITCPRHSDGLESTPACFINIGNEDAPYLWSHCFVCGLSEPFEKVIAEAMDRSEEYVKKWLVDNYGGGYAGEYVELPKIKLETKPTTPKFLNESILNQFESYHPYMSQRKISDEVIRDFQIKYDPKTKSIVFPVRDRLGRLKFLTRRSIEGKRFIIDKGAEKKDIYLMDQVYKKDLREVIIVESQINSLVSYSYGKPAIAMFGAGCPKEQIDELNKTGVIRYILMMDNDQAGRKGAERLKTYLGKNKIVIDVIMPPGKDVADLTREEFYNLLKENGVN